MARRTLSIVSCMAFTILSMVTFWVLVMEPLHAWRIRLSQVELQSNFMDNLRQAASLITEDKSSGNAERSPTIPRTGLVSCIDWSGMRHVSSVHLPSVDNYQVSSLGGSGVREPPGRLRDLPMCVASDHLDLLSGASTMQKELWGCS